MRDQLLEADGFGLGFGVAVGCAVGVECAEPLGDG